MSEKDSKTSRRGKPAARRRTRAEESAPEPPKSLGPCVVCGEPIAPFSSERLCWVCRRLKISAWRDSDNAAQMQE